MRGEIKKKRENVTLEQRKSRKGSTINFLKM